MHARHFRVRKLLLWALLSLMASLSRRISLRLASEFPPHNAEYNAGCRTRRMLPISITGLVGTALFFDFLLVTMLIPMAPTFLSPRRTGLLFAAKPLAQAVLNPVIASLRADDAKVLMSGTLVGGLGAIAFGLVDSYVVMMVIRLVQGGASAALMTGGMSLLMGSCEGEHTRARAASRVLLGLTLGVTSGERRSPHIRSRNRDKALIRHGTT